MVERRALLLAGDLVVGFLALGLALVIWVAAGQEWYGLSSDFFRLRVSTWFYFLPLAWLLLLVDLYDVHRSADWRDTLRGVLISALIGAVLYSLVYITSPANSLPRIGVAAYLVCAAALTLLWRGLYIRVLTAPRFQRRVLVIGAGRAGETILNVINDLQPAPFRLVGLIDDDSGKHGEDFCGYPVLAGSDHLLELVDRHAITDLIVAISGEMQGSTFQTLLDTQERGIEITRMPVAYEELRQRVPIEILETDWILRSFVDETRVSGFFEAGKRFLDILGGLAGATILLLVLPFVSLATLLETGRPVFYLQTRLGKGGRPYQIIKFRTMRQDAEADGKPRWATEGDERATRVGMFLRKTHLDEVPQFLNVLRGEMSLVGPRAERPQLVEHFQAHVPFYRARLLVKPGITGWAQVNYGYAASIDETKIKLEYDLYYIKHRSILLDLLVLIKTPGTVFGMRGQ